jgi:DNA repair exonuclease SbcCD ATPase subunit
MKIKGLLMENFTRYEKAEVSFPSKVNILVARNAEGKTSIVDAVTYALTGRCARTDGAGRGAEAMVRTGEREAEISLAISANGDNDYTLGRKIPGGLWMTGHEASQKNLQEFLYQVIGADQGAVTAALNTFDFLWLKPDEQKSLLFNLLGLSFEADDVKRSIAGEIDEDRVEAEGLLGAAPLSLFDGTGNTYANLYQHFYDLRRNYKRRLKELGAFEPLVVKDMPPREEVTDKLETLQGERTEKNQKLRDARAATERRTCLESELEELEKDLEKAGPPPEDAEKAQAKASEMRSKAVSKTDESMRLMKAAEGLASAAANKACPLAPGFVTCPLGKAKRDGLVEEIEKASMTLDSEILSLQEKAHKLEERFGDVRDGAKLEGQASGIRQELANIPETPDIMSGDFLDKIHELDERIIKGKSILEEIDQAAGARQAMEAVMKERTRLSGHVDLLERLVEITSPKGIPGRLLAETVGPLEKLANERLSLLTGGQYSLHFEVNPWGIQVTHEGSTSDLGRLSSSERMRIGIILQDAVSRLSGLRVMMIDNADVLDPGNRALLIETLTTIKDDYDSIIVMSTRGPDGIENPHLEDLSVFEISEGSIKEVK